MMGNTTAPIQISTMRIESIVEFDSEENMLDSHVILKLLLVISTKASLTNPERIRFWQRYYTFVRNEWPSIEVAA